MMLRRALAGLFAALAIVVLAAPAGAISPVEPPPPVPDPAHPIVVIGVDGLRWDQISASTPGLDQLARSAATGLLAARGADEKTSTLDAWATLSAGNRARARDLPDITQTSTGAEQETKSDPGIAVAQRQTDPARTGARVGALADAVGPDCIAAGAQRGPQLAAATSTGRRALVPAEGCPVVLLEAPGVGAAEALLRYWQSQASLLLVIGLGDDEVPGHLHVAIASGKGFDAGRLTSGSTRRAGYVQMIDVAPTILAALGRPEPSSMIGRPWRLHDRQALDRDAYLTADRRARFMPTAVLGVVLPLVVGFVFSLVAAGLLCLRGRRDLGWEVARWSCRVVAAVPVATFLARLIPYEPAGLFGLWVLILTIDAAVVAACRGRVAVIAAVTAVVLALDILVGAPLQLHSVLGYSALVAGRFAGLGNPAFGAFAAAVLVTAMLVGGALGGPAAQRRPGQRAAAVAGVGVVAVVVDGAPMLGSDVGGVLALVPAFALLAWSVSGRRIRVRTVLLAALAAVAVIALFAAVDLARAPESRTHLGRFASDLLNGRAGETLSRKAAANVDLLTRNVATLLVLPVMAILAVVVARADRWSATAPFGQALQREPGLRVGLGAALIAGTLGFAVNDSGVVVPAVMMMIVVPAAIEAADRHREPDEDDDDTTPAGPAEQDADAAAR